MNAFDYFDAMFVINRGDRPDRLALAYSEFRSAGIADRVVRIPAIMPQHSATIVKDRKAACTESHRMAIRAAIAVGASRPLIFEDDVCFVDLSRLAAAIEELKTLDWGLFYLGGYPVQRHEVKPILDCPHLVQVVRGYICAHAYAIRPCHLELLQGEEIIDIQLANNVQPAVLSVVPRTFVASQRSDYSDLKGDFCQREHIIEKHNAMIRGMRGSRV